MIKLQNNSDIEQPAYGPDGKKWVLSPYEVRDVSDEIGRAFLEQRPRYVQIYQPVHLPIPPGARVMWIANMSGSPWSPKKKTKFSRDPRTGVEKPYEIDNPVAAPRTVVRTLQLEQSVQDSTRGSFKETVSHPPVTVRIPPYMRLPFPYEIGEWLLRRDSQMEEDSQGLIMECRPPDAFEPNDSWDYDEILVYAEMVDNTIDWRKQFKLMKKDAASAERSKMELLHALFFKLVDRKYALPPQVAFDIELESYRNPKPLGNSGSSMTA